jgi:predicted PurR-regulated permease PerM
LLTLFIFVPPILDDAANFFSNLPNTLESIDVSQGLSSSFFPGQTVKISPSQFADQIRATFATFTGGIFSTLSSFFGGVISFVLIIVFSIYFAVQETGIDDFLRVITPVKHEKYVLSLWKRSQDKIGKWMQGQLLLGLIVGILIYLGLTILNVPHALLLAVLAGAFELIPVFGQIIAALPAVALAFSDGGVTGALFVIGLYTVVQQFEAHLIYPLVVKKVVGVPPLLVILALLIGAKLAGFLGILLSVPVAAAFQELVSDIMKAKERQLARMREAE